jgi:hypothetical protein
MDLQAPRRGSRPAPWNRGGSTCKPAPVYQLIMVYAYRCPTSWDLFLDLLHTA